MAFAFEPASRRQELRDSLRVRMPVVRSFNGWSVPLNFSGNQMWL